MNVFSRRRVYLMRHGSVTYFDAAGKPYLPETVPLNELGRAQASAAGRLFADESVRFDRVIVSGLPRTVETATRVLAETGQDIAFDTWPEWEEIRGGRLASIPDDQLRDAFLGAFAGMPDEARQFLGGETVGQLLDRVHPAVDRLRADPDWDIALLVLHGGVNRAILSYLLTGQRIFLGGIAQAAGCINAIDIGHEQLDCVLRYANHSPTAPLQTATRHTTMEQLYQQYLKSRQLPAA